MSDPGKAVFLSYASQDAEAAKRICEALCAAGVEVWFDQSELVGGDAWDQKIRKQIKECALLVPIISQNTQARTEGYFRLEWRLADQRTHLMGRNKAFLLPVSIDGTTEADADVPDSFTAVQWTKASGGEVPPAFCARVKQLLVGGVGTVSDRSSGGSAPSEAGQRPASPRKRPIWLVAAIVLAAIAAGTWQQQRNKARTAPSEPKGPAIAPAAQLSEAQQLVARVWELLNKPELARAELGAAGDLCQQAAGLAPLDAEVLAAWSQVDSWQVYLGFDATMARRESARTKAERALQFAPKSFEARLARACYLVRGRSHGGISQFSSETEPLLRGLLQERPAEPRTLLVLAICLRDQKKHSEARAVLEELARNPAFAAVAWNEMGWAALFTRDIAAAEAAADKSIALQPCWHSVSLKLQIVLFVGGDLAEARAALLKLPESALQEDYGALLAWWVYSYCREWDNAVRAIAGVSREWLHAPLGDGPRSAFIGMMHAYAGRDAMAEVEWRTALKLIEQRLAETPNDAALLGWKGTVLVALGDRVGGEKFLGLSRALKNSPPPETEGFDRLQLGQLEEAIACFERATSAGILPGWFTTAASFRLDPRHDPLRGLPRFQALQARLDADPLFSAAARSRPPATAASAPLSADAKSVAVLAFANRSDDKANEYFSDGISEELLNVLAKVPGLKVTARTSSFHFKGKDTPVPEIARQLGVAYVIEGSVRKAGNQVRITAQLIKASDGFQVWSDTFTRDLKDIFAVQDEIAGLIAQQLQLKLGGAGRTASPIKPEAFELYVQARRAWNLRNAAGFAQAEELLTRALMLEPDFGRARVALADVWTLRAIANGVIDTFGQRQAPIFTQITSEIQKALTLDPDSSEARASWGLIVRLQQWDLAAAEREFRRSIELNPNYATAHHWLGTCLFESGRVDEGLVELRRAAELDPFSLRILEGYAEGLVHAGRPEEGLVVLGRAEALQAKAPLTLFTKAEALLQLGRRIEAMAVARELNDEDRAELLARAGEKSEAEAALADAEGWSRYQLLTALGRTAEALAALQAEDVSVAEAGNWLMDPALDPFRKDPHFVELLKTLGLTEAHARMQAWRAAQAKR